MHILGSNTNCIMALVCTCTMPLVHASITNLLHAWKFYRTHGKIEFKTEYDYDSTNIYLTSRICIFQGSNMCVYYRLLNACPESLLHSLENRVKTGTRM